MGETEWVMPTHIIAAVRVVTNSKDEKPEFELKLKRLI